MEKKINLLNNTSEIWSKILEESLAIKKREPLLNSFVDKNLRVLGSKNVYICSSSFFPTSGSVNPTIIILAFALRLSKHILNTKNFKA